MARGPVPRKALDAKATKQPRMADIKPPQQRAFMNQVCGSMLQVVFGTVVHVIKR